MSSQCVPSWELEENPRLTFHPNCNMNESKAPDSAVDSLQNYEVAELTYENGQIAMHGLGPPRLIKPVTSKYTWEKPLASGTLESIVNQAVQLGPCEPPIPTHNDELVPWFNPHQAIRDAAMVADALVPSSSSIHFVHEQRSKQHTASQGVGTCVSGKSTRVESCGGTATSNDRGKEVEGANNGRKRHRAPPPRAMCSRSVSVSETFGRESRHVGADSCDMDMDRGFTSTSLESDTNPNAIDDRDSVSHTRPHKQARTDEKSCQNEKSAISTKRSRAAAIHNQSERKRRDKINQRMKTLQKLVPNSNKTDKASMLDEVIEYLKTLQAQVQMMSRISMPHMMMPMTMQQQMQMAMMAQMGQMGMSMGMGVMDINAMAHPNIGGMPHVLNPAAAFMPPMASWDGSNDRMPSSSGAALLHDPMANFLACPSQMQQPMTMDAYSRMAALYQQQLHLQQQVPNMKP